MRIWLYFAMLLLNLRFAASAGETLPDPEPESTPKPPELFVAPEEIPPSDEPVPGTAAETLPGPDLELANGLDVTKATPPAELSEPVEATSADETPPLPEPIPAPNPEPVPQEVVFGAAGLGAPGELNPKPNPSRPGKPDLTVAAEEKTPDEPEPEPKPRNENKANGREASPENKAADKPNADKLKGKQDSANQNPDLVRTEIAPTLPFYEQYSKKRGVREDDNALKGFRFDSGHVVVKPFADLSSNYFQFVGDKGPDVMQTYAVGTAFSYTPNKLFDIKGSYRFSWNDYTDDKAKDYLTHDATLNFEFKPSKDLKFNLYETYAQSGNVGTFNRETLLNFDDATFNTFSIRQAFLDFSRLQNYLAGISTNYHYKKIDIQASFEDSHIDYFGRTANLDDTDTRTFRTSFGYKYSPKISPYLLYTYDNIAFMNSAQKGSESHTWNAGVIVQVKKKVAVTAYVTPRVINDFQTKLQNRDLDATIGVSYDVLKRINVFFSGTTGFADAQRGPDGQLFGATVELKAKLQRDLELFMFSSFRNIESDPHTFSETNLYGLRLDYRIQRHLRMSAGWSRSDIWNHDQSVRSHDEFNMGKLGLSARF